MSNEEAKTVTPGEKLNLLVVEGTPGKKFGFALTTPQKIAIVRVLREPSGYVHFDAGYKLPEGELPLKSRDTGNVIDGTNTYWMHPSRFERDKGNPGTNG